MVEETNEWNAPPLLATLAVSGEANSTLAARIMNPKRVVKYKMPLRIECEPHL